LARPCCTPSEEAGLSGPGVEVEVEASTVVVVGAGIEYRVDEVEAVALEVREVDEDVDDDELVPDEPFTPDDPPVPDEPLAPDDRLLVVLDVSVAETEALVEEALAFDTSAAPAPARATNPRKVERARRMRLIRIYRRCSERWTYLG
jgi:hypothetical protein